MDPARRLRRARRRARDDGSRGTRLASFVQSHTFERVAPAQEYHKLAAAAGLEKPTCKGLNLGLSVHVERDLVIKVMVRVRLPTRLTSNAQVQSKVRAAFAAGASGKKKLNKREQKDARGSVRLSDSRR